MWDRVVHGAQASARVCFSPFLLVSHVDRLVVGWVIRGGPVVKNLPAKELEAGDTSSIPGLGRPPGGEMATHSSILPWRIPWTEEPGGLQSIRSQRVRHD